MEGGSRVKGHLEYFTSYLTSLAKEYGYPAYLGILWMSVLLLKDTLFPTLLSFFVAHYWLMMLVPLGSALLSFIATIIGNIIEDDDNLAWEAVPGIIDSIISPMFWFVAKQGLIMDIALSALYLISLIPNSFQVITLSISGLTYLAGHYWLVTLLPAILFVSYFIARLTAEKFPFFSKGFRVLFRAMVFISSVLVLFALITLPFVPGISIFFNDLTLSNMIFITDHFSLILGISMTLLGLGYGFQQLAYYCQGGEHMRSKVWQRFVFNSIGSFLLIESGSFFLARGLSSIVSLPILVIFLGIGVGIPSIFFLVSRYGKRQDHYEAGKTNPKEKRSKLAFSFLRITGFLLVEVALPLTLLALSAYSFGFSDNAVVFSAAFIGGMVVFRWSGELMQLSAYLRRGFRRVAELITSSSSVFTFVAETFCQALAGVAEVGNLLGEALSGIFFNKENDRHWYHGFFLRERRSEHRARAQQEERLKEYSPVRYDHEDTKENITAAFLVSEKLDTFDVYDVSFSCSNSSFTP